MPPEQFASHYRLEDIPLPKLSKAQDRNAPLNRELSQVLYARFSGYLNDDQRMYLDSLRRLMTDIATPGYLRSIDEEGRYPYELYDAWVEIGQCKTC